MAYLNDPSLSVISRNVLFSLDLFAPLSHMGNVSSFYHGLVGRFSRIPLVGAEVLRDLFLIGRVDDDLVQNQFQLRDIMPICSGHDERQRDTTAAH